MAQPSGVERTAALAVLGLTEGATPGQIISAYRRLAKATHPDATGRADVGETERFADVSDAYHRLTENAARDGGPPAVGRPTASPMRVSPSWFGPPGQRPPIVAGPVTVTPIRTTGPTGEGGGS
jgi:hypothetical protein